MESDRAVLFGGSCARHRGARRSGGDKLVRPMAWTRWRRNREGYDYWTRDGWRAVSSTIAAAPPGLRLDGRYAHETCGAQPDGSGVCRRAGEA
jgi:hypothetical protein